MTDIDRLANALFGGKRAESQEVLTDATTRTYIGTATTDSEDGSVYVSLDGDVTLPDDIVDPDGNVIKAYEDNGIEVSVGPSVTEGDEVIVTLVGGGPLKTPMVTSVAGEGDRQDAAIDEAARAAEAAWEWADEAHTAATTAQQKAEEAAQSAADAAESAEAAATAATSAQADASTAAQAATAAQGSASTAATAATSAQKSASTAATAASNAEASASAAASDASSAQASAAAANTAANSALTQLSVVEDVAGTLQWISDHGTFVPTTDTTVQDGTVYFAHEGGDYVPIAEPSGNPKAQGWYVLDVSESQTDYIMAHLAVTSAGLWVLPSGIGGAAGPQTAPGYKLLLASDGARLYDASGQQVMDYGESISMSSSRPQYIGGERAFIIYYDSDDDGVMDTIRIGGNVLMGVDKTLSEVLAEVSQASEDAAEAKRAAEDVPIVTLSSTNGTVFKRQLGVSTTVIVTIFTPGGRIDDATALARRFGSGAYLEWGWRDVVTDAEHVLPVTDPRITAGGFRLTVSPEDIDTQAVITCSLNY